MARRIQDHGEFTARELAGLAREGDETAQQIFADAGRYLGMALATLVNVFNLPLYVIGGGVVSGLGSVCSAHVRGVAQAELHLRIDCTGEGPAIHGRKTYVVPAATGPDAGLLGAAMLPYLEAGLL